MAIQQPLAGVRVLDLTQIYNGPYATFLMAMAGAEVIKVEPIGGEFLRRRDASSGAFVPFAMLNACKDSVSLNLKSDEGREIFYQMLKDADVVVENYAPGVIDRLGIGYDALRERKPDIILASGSGYGQDGAYRDYMAMDLTIQAMSGVMSVTGYADGPPTKSGAALCDFLGGVHLFGAISTALYRRSTTGEGARIDVSMLEAVYITMASNIGMTFGARKDIPLRTGNRHGGLSLCPYNVYPAKDGYVAIICNNDVHWEGLARAMERPDLITAPETARNRDRVANMEMVDALVAGYTRGKGKYELLDLLQSSRVPSAPVRDLPEVIADPVLHERGALVDVDHPAFGTVTLPRSAIRFADAPPPEYRCSPEYGADNARIYGALGLGAEALVELSRKGVI
jgi:CoA:oxalate CoA-transferase